MLLCYKVWSLLHRDQDQFLYKSIKFHTSAYVYRIRTVWFYMFWNRGQFRIIDREFLTLDWKKYGFFNTIWGKWACISLYFYLTAFFPWSKYLKSDSHFPKKNCVICLIESPLKMMKNAFCFILKAFIILKIFKFLSRLFGHVGKTGWLER